MMADGRYDLLKLNNLLNQAVELTCDMIAANSIEGIKSLDETIKNIRWTLDDVYAHWDQAKVTAEMRERCYIKTGEVGQYDSNTQVR
jgi:hypothetical protein